MSKFVIFTVFILSLCTQAQERIELGLGAGNTHPLSGNTFNNLATSGDGQVFWLGYGLTKNWAVELGLDQLDFDAIKSKHKAIIIDAAYRFYPETMIHPVVKLGLASVESTTALDLKLTSFGAKAAAGFEADFCKNVSLGFLLNYYLVTKTDDALDLKNTQAWMPALFFSFHNALGTESPAVTKSTAISATAPAATVAAKDADGDGVTDQDDKCPNTPAGVAVDKIGCSVKEKAKVKLNVEFDSGKATLDSKSNGEIEELSNFMKKFPETKAEIAGHTDNLGAPAVNNSLSQKRAEAVKAALVKAGVEATRLTAKGYGSSQPIADNKTKAGRDDNRRVTAEITVTADKSK